MRFANNCSTWGLWSKTLLKEVNGKSLNEFTSGQDAQRKVSAGNQVHSGGRSAKSDSANHGQYPPQCSTSDFAGRDRVGQDLHDGAHYRRNQFAHADFGAEQNLSRPAL